MVRYRGMPEAKDSEPVPIEKPDCLAGYAAEHWDCVVPQLHKMGILRPVDVEALRALCQWWAEYRTLQVTLPATEGDSYKRSISLASCFKNWSNLAARFGLTPKDQEKLDIKPLIDDVVAEYLR